MDYLETFSDRLLQLMTEEETEEKELAQKSGVELSCLYSYLRKSSYPSTKSAIKLASFFACSLDYLFGFADDFEKKTFILTDTTANRLKIALAEEKLTRYRLSKIISVSESTLCLWCNAKRQPELESLLKISESLGVSLDFLVGRKT